MTDCEQLPATSTAPTEDDSKTTLRVAFPHIMHQVKRPLEKPPATASALSTPHPRRPRRPLDPRAGLTEKPCPQTATGCTPGITNSGRPIQLRRDSWILRPVRATIPLWREPPCRGGVSHHDAAGAPWRRFADGPARGAYGRAWSGVSAGAESPAGDPPPPTAGQPSWLKCLRIESSQVRTVACAFVVMRSMMASASHR